MHIHTSQPLYSEREIKTLLHQWYKQAAQQILTTRTLFYEKKIQTQGYNVRASKIQIKNYKARWGSCSIEKEISYNWKIILAPKEIIDYLIVHELCHIIEHNHSKNFWALVATFDPHYREHREWLKKHGLTLEV